MVSSTNPSPSTDQPAHERLQRRARSRSNTSDKQRVTVRIPEQLLERVEQLVEDGEYPNRSEAMRSAIDDLIVDWNDRTGQQPHR